MNEDVATLIARLLSLQAIARDDALAMRALTDEAFREELDNRLAACGLKLLDNPYASHIAVGLQSRMEGRVFGSEDGWLCNNLGLDRDAVALLVVIWALLILPKRQRQIERKDKAGQAAQSEMFAQYKPMPRGDDVTGFLLERTLIADFGEKLGKSTRVKINLGQLARLGFIKKSNDRIVEGPLLDLALDYGTLAPRILDGALSDLLRQRPDTATTSEAAHV